jgi:WD40 repeat protein/tetratricopeptide (TPR) repeat protein
MHVYEVGEHDGQPFLALEWVDGGTLAQRLAGTPLPPRAAAALVETLADAVQHAHAAGVVHRDLKPGNVLLRRKYSPPGPGVADAASVAEDEPLVADFGLARPLDEDYRLTQTGAAAGTPNYMAPEQAAGDDRAGAPADVYALGAILYELLTGRPPFQGSTPVDTLDLVRHTEPVPPGQLAPRLPRDLETICLKCLEKEPARRYASAAALADDLGRFRRGEPIVARPVGPLGRAWKWARRRPSLALLLALTAAALVGGTGVSAYFAVEAGQRARDAERAGEEKQRALEDAQKAQRQSDLRSAELQFRAGLHQCEAGAVDHGLFTMLEAWRSAPKDAITLRRVLRTNLAAWSQQLPVLEQMLQHPDGGRVLTRFVGADGNTLVTWAFRDSRQVVRWDAATGQPLGPPFLVPGGEAIVNVNAEGTLLTTERQGTSMVRELATGRLLGSGFTHRMPDQPGVGSHALFCGPGPIVVTKSPDTSHLWRFRRFWQFPPHPGTTETVKPLLTVELQPGDTYHVTAAAGGDPVAVVFRQQVAAPSGRGPPQAEFWELTTGKRLPALSASPGKTDPRISWDGQTILSVSSNELWGFLPGADGTVRWWDTATGRMSGEPWRPRRLAQHSTLSAEGQLLVACGHDDRVRLFDLARGQQRGGDILTTGFPGQEIAPRVGVSPDGSRIATASLDGVVRLWQTRHLLPQTTNAANPRVPTSNLSRPAFDTGTLSGDGRTGLVRVATDLGVGGLVARLAGPLAAPLRQKHLYHCAFSSDGALIATAPNNNSFGGKPVVSLWDRTGRPCGLPLNQYRYVHSLAFSPDSSTLAVGCVGGTLLWDVATRRLRHVLRESSTAADLLFSPDGTRLAAVHISGWPGVGAGVRLWDTSSGRPVGEFLAAPHPVRTRPFFVLAFTEGGQTLRVFDLITGRLHALDVRTGAAQQASLVLAPAAEAAFSAGGSALATSHSNGSVQQWDPATGQRKGTLLELPQPAARLRYSPDGQVLAIACRDQSVRLWDTVGCVPLGPPLLHRAGVLDLRFTPDGAALVTLTATGRLHTWPLPQPVTDEPERMELWLRASGGVGLENNAIVLLDVEAWRRCRERLQERWPEADPALHRPADESDWHDARACDAEEDSNTFAALWHLDRLIALRPKDWQLLGRKGLLYARAGDLDLAGAAYRRAAKHAPAEALRDWHRQNVATCLVQGQWSAALRHLDGLVAAGGEDWQAHADRATAFGHLGKRLESEAACARAVQRGADAAFLVPLAEEKAAQGQWPEAAALFAGAAERGGLDVLDECHHALTCLKVGDEAGYRRICAGLVHDLETDGPQTTAVRRGSVSHLLGLFRVCLLRADAVPSWQPLLQVAEEILAALTRALARTPEGQLQALRRDWLAVRGAVLSRQGRYREAIPSLQQALGPDGKAGNAAARAFLAFAHLRLNQKAEASRWVDKPLAPQAGAMFSWEALEAELLRPFLEELQKELRAADK